MAIQKIKANKTASLTDLRDPMKVIQAAGDDPVAIMNRNQVVGYFVPASRADSLAEPLKKETFTAVMSEVVAEEQEVLDYLKDK